MPKGKQPEKKRHHTVPRLYLKRFSRNGKQVGVFNKRTGIGILLPLADACVENHFYKANISVVTRPIDGEQYSINGTFVEDPLLSTLETKYGPKLSTFIDHISSRKRITDEQKDDLAFHIAIQWLRTQGIRDELSRFGSSLADKVASQFPGEVPEPLASQLKQLRKMGSEEGSRKEHLKAILDPGLWRVFSHAVKERHWMILSNMTDFPFYTSDSPVNIIPYGQDMFENSGHITTPKSELVFPITPQYLLLAYSHDLTTMESRAGLVLDADRGLIIHYNHIQYAHCKNHLVTGITNYRLANDFHTLSISELDRKYGGLYYPAES
jgi:hypothetical protein